MIMCNDECWLLTHQGHSQSTSSAALLELQTHARATELYLRCLRHTTYHLGFPSLTEVEAAMSEGPYSSPLSCYQQLLSGGPSVTPFPLPNLALDLHSGRSRSQHGFLLSPLLRSFLWRT